MTLTGREKAALRAEAHHLTAIVHVGKEGLSRTVVQSLDDALRTHELVKVQLGKTLELAPRDAAHELATSSGSDVIQVIGRTVTLYRENPELKRKAGDLPPWR
ncbi:MAG: ribosome assembly RNA-binding protein YhbY [Gemmatimonadaceae bacterium]